MELATVFSFLNCKTLCPSMQLPYQLIHHMIFKFHEEPSAKKGGEISYSMFLEFQIPLLSDVCANPIQQKQAPQQDGDPAPPPSLPENFNNKLYIACKQW